MDLVILKVCCDTRFPKPESRVVGRCRLILSWTLCPKPLCVTTAFIMSYVFKTD